MDVLRTLLPVVLVLAAAAGAARGEEITPADIEAVQSEWAAAVVAIGAAHGAGQDHEALARAALARLYAHDLGPVLFKPTMAHEVPFRDTAEEALSYFIGGGLPEDEGFAIHPWTDVRFENFAIIIDADDERALASGHYYFTDPEGHVLQAEYSFGYILHPDGGLRIDLHHSSLPHEP